MIGVCLFLGILAGSWGLTWWYANQIPEPHRDAGGTRVRDPRGAPDHRADRANHVGVKLVEVNGQRFVILPESTPENPLLSMDGRPTVRLSSE